MLTPSEKVEHQRSAARRYRQRHLEEVRAKERERYHEHREEVLLLKRREYAADRENKIATVRRWQSRNPLKVKQSQKSRNLWRWYRMTIEEFHAMFLRQGQVCAICKNDEPYGKRTWHVDHDHKTGKIRGILCSPCNLMLGHAKDNPETLRAASAYLRTSP